MQLPKYTNNDAVSKLDKQLSQELSNDAHELWTSLSKIKCIDRYITKDGDIWMCKAGHRFRHFNRMECPVCNSSKWERIWYALSAKRFGISNVQKDFIGMIELDIVIPKLKTAIEYNGAQHYTQGYFTKNLDYRKLLDQNKIDICNQNDIKLIVLKYNTVEDNWKKWNEINDLDSTNYEWILHKMRTSIAYLKNKT